jgi:hypothetical protein
VPGKVPFHFADIMFNSLGGAIMDKSKSKQKKREETTEEFVKRINQHEEWSKHNGTKKGPGHHHR